MSKLKISLLTILLTAAATTSALIYSNSDRIVFDGEPLPAHIKASCIKGLGCWIDEADPVAAQKKWP